MRILLMSVAVMVVAAGLVFGVIVGTHAATAKPSPHPVCVAHDPFCGTLSH